MILYYVIDVETTGLKPDFHELTEISIIRCSDRNQLTKMVKVEYPERASKQALIVTNKTYEDLKKGESLPDVIDRINEFIFSDDSKPENRCFIAHNENFDRRFCHFAWEKQNKQFPGDMWFCTKEFTRAYAKRNGILKPRLSLEESLILTKTASKPGKHTAKSDVRNTFLLWDNLMKSGLDYIEQIKLHPHILV